MSRILVVEDDRVVRLVLSTTLRLEGHVVEVVPRLEAARLALDEAFDLVFVDICLPDGLGFELLQFLADRGGDAPPVVIISSLGQDVNVRRALELGAIDFVPKPFSPSDLQERLGGWTGGHAVIPR